MAQVPPFYSAQEAQKPADKRVYHNNSGCPAGQDIRQPDRRSGTNNYRLCDDCAERNRRGV